MTADNDHPSACWSDPGSSGPLAGVRVLDLTTVVMGPSATRILADLGADVLKIESPGGDSMRYVGPGRDRSMGPLFLQANHNKRSLRLDLKDPGDLAVLRALIPTADVFVSNVRPAGLARLGLAHADVRALNESLVYCTAVGYGSAGPQAGKAVYDDLMQAASGVAALFGQVDGAPRYAPVNLCDRVVGTYLAIGVLSALFHRQRTGQGQHVEVPMFETMAQFVLADHIGGEAFVPAAGEMGYRRLLSSTRGPYPTRDGHIAVVVYTDAHWRAFCALTGLPDLTRTDPRFADLPSRTVHAEEVGAFLSDRFTGRTTAEWLELLAGADIPASRVNGLRDLLDDDHLRRSGLFQQAEHPTEGRVTLTRFPVAFERTPTDVRRLAPRLGQEHTGGVSAPATEQAGAPGEQAGVPGQDSPREEGLPA